MSKWHFSQSLLRSISDRARELSVLSGSHPPLPTLEAHVSLGPPLDLPGVRVSTEYLIDMGFQPAVAQRLLDVFMKFVYRYRRVSETYFRHAIRGGCHLPLEYYRDVFVVQYERMIQGWGSQFLSTAWIWLRRAGPLPTAFRIEHIDIRVDDAAKAHVLSKLGLDAPSRGVASVGMGCDVKIVSPFEDELKKEGASFVKPAKPYLSLASSSLVSSARRSSSKYCDLFSQPVPSTCFPALYPPPPDGSYSSRRSLATSFTRTASVQIEKPSASRTNDVSSLINTLCRMFITTSEGGAGAQRSCERLGVPKIKKTHPLFPSSSPVIASASDPNETRSMNSGSTPLGKSTNVPRRRRIAALPTRRTKAPTSSSIPNSPSTSTSEPAVTIPPIINSTAITSYARSAKGPTAGELPDYVIPPPETVHLSTLPTQHTSGTSGLSSTKTVASKQRKMLPLPRRTLSQPQAAPLSSQALSDVALPGRKMTLHPISRTPSLVSDTSSGADSSSSSSDELDTPPSTPSSSLQALPTRSKATEEAFIVPESPTTTMRGQPLIGNAKLPKPKDKGIHIDFTKGCVGHTERPLTFTFSA